MTNLILKSIEIHHFKCFDELEFPLEYLTVFSGYNGAGKSAAIQSILLLSQALNNKSETNGKMVWPLNGEFVRLGSVGDVVNKRVGGLPIELKYSLSDEKSPLRFEFTGETGKRNLKTVAPAKKYETSINKFDFITNLQFLGPVRSDISEIVPKPDNIDYIKEGIGIDGRYAGYWFDQNENKEIPKNQQFTDSLSAWFSPQFGAWLDYISPGTSVSVQNISDSSFLALKYRDSETGELINPANVGYGITYVFPIIVSLLSAKKGDLLIIDSPEAHLHPRAQSRVGEMIAKFASSGIQIIVETHSDHVLSGIRIAVKDAEIKPDDVSLLFFSGCTADGNGVNHTPIDKLGQIKYWPEGFFDQSEKDLYRLLGSD